MGRCRLALLVLLLTLAGVSQPLVARANSPQLDTLATQLAGTPVTVSCFAPGSAYYGWVWATSDDLGATWHLQSIIHLSGELCGALQNVLTPGPQDARWLTHAESVYKVGLGLLALTHEATHIALSSVDEGLVECTAFHNVVNSARLLPLGWKMRSTIATAARQFHLDTLQIPEYRSVC